MKLSLFLPSEESEARLLLLVAGFTTRTRGLQGRTKLAKLDFLLRYPQYLRRALAIRAPQASSPFGETPETIESRMIRFRYGPWDPAYFALLGSLIGRALIESRPGRHGYEYWVTPQGADLASRIGAAEAWAPTLEAVRLLKRHFDLSGSSLKDFVYEHFPEVTRQEWGRLL